jgi:ketosteroid isomerase-like protein
MRPLTLCTLLVLIFTNAACARPSLAPSADPAADIRAVLDAQVRDWNAGSIEGYMDGYARSEALRFASGGRIRTGWQAALDAYRAGYPDRAAMGTLSFEDLDVRILSPGWALVFGRWRLTRAEDEPWGLFTLLMERRPEGWRIVHDHTSSGS